MSLPRCYFEETGQSDSITLCGFCDASTRAYTAVIYMLSKTETRVLSRFVAAKMRVAPLQVQTVPRLELLSALLLSRLLVSVRNYLQREVPNISVRCYTDSQVALYWIRGKEKEWKPFVRNRVNEICDNVHPALWNHCPGSTNPADLPSRGLTMVELSLSHLWHTGPDWLSMEVPLSSAVEPSAMPEQCSQELSSSSKLSHNLVMVEGPTIGALLECGNYSTWTRLVRVSAYVLRAVAQFKARKRSDSPGALTVQEITATKLLWLLHAQGALAQHKDFDSLSALILNYAHRYNGVKETLKEQEGVPLKFLSDNGKTFKATATFVDLLLKDNTIKEYLAVKGSQWVFNVERATW
ncbi:hypothetical protein EMCRGX_G022912 [Ephydatia muelleri]